MLILLKLYNQVTLVSKPENLSAFFWGTTDSKTGIFGRYSYRIMIGGTIVNNSPFSKKQHIMRVSSKHPVKK